MISTRNKSISFFLCVILTVISWGIIFLNVILRITTFFEFGLDSVDTIGFTFTTILLTFYTLIVLFKISGVSYFPIVLILLHMATLNGSTLAILFVIVDLIIMVLLNTGTDQSFNTKTTYYQRAQANEQAQPKRPLDNGDVFDAEYKEK